MRAMSLDFQQLQQAYLRRQHARVAVNYGSSIKLYMLPVRATLNDLHRQVDTPKNILCLYLCDGRPIPRTDEYMSHFFARCGSQPVHTKPVIFGVNCVMHPMPSLAVPGAPVASGEPLESAAAPMQVSQGTAEQSAPAAQPHAILQRDVPGAAESSTAPLA